MNLLHDIPAGTPDELNVIIEIPHGSHNKYEVDKETGMIALDRANYGPAPYPTNYGFIPQTHWDDGDAIDVLLISSHPIPSGILVSSRAVGVMRMIDDGESDDKIICVPVNDRRMEDIQDIADVNKHLIKEIQHFFETIKQLKGKPVVVEVKGFEGKEAAVSTLERARKMYQEKNK
ncbi:MAG TPA: inorganic diphosphatase [Candidatus Paceibacterota bacterium]|nr:inorganic diphosphatase [Candidatus Paceibacterota bacterium]